MLGRLPTSLNINSKEYSIRSDYRVVLTIFQAYNEPDYSEDEKIQIAIECLLEHPEELQDVDVVEASKQVAWFLSGGEQEDDNANQSKKKLLDWEQDEQLVFSAVNKVAGKEVRAVEYLHWWTFLGYFKDRGECMLNTIINLRDKINRHQKLSSDEREFYKSNQRLIDLKERLTAEEQAQDDYYRNLLKQYGC